MAENGEAKKPVVEMSIWFIILLVVLIISTILVIKINDEKTALAAELERAQNEITTVRTEKNNIINDLQEVAKKVNSNAGNYSTNEVVRLFTEKLQEAGYNVEVDENLNITPVVTEVDSGEAEQVVVE